jgi:hypothetical protein
MVTTAPTRPWTSAEVCALAGVSYRQLDVWARNGWLHPDRHGTADADYQPTSGYPRAWHWPEVVKACALAGMVRAGISHAKAAELVAAGMTAELATRPLSELVDDLPPDSRDHAIVIRAAGP